MQGGGYQVQVGVEDGLFAGRREQGQLPVLVEDPSPQRGEVVARRPGTGEFAKPGASYEILRQEVSGDIACIVWTAETADNRFEVASDTFVVQNGKIAAQTFTGKISPKR